MKKLKSYFIIILGLLITAAAISLFYVPNKIVSGGVSGISTILYHSFKIPTGLSFGFINLFLLICGLKFLGKEFTVKTLLGAGLLSLFVQLFSYIPPVTDNIFLATIFGSILYGFGIGLTLICGASSGGTDILARLIQYFIPHMEIGKMLLFVDSVVIITSLLVFKTIDLVLYGIIALFLSTYAIDFLIRKLNISKLAFVITEKGNDIATYLISTSPRGVTIIDVVGGYTMEEKQMLVCALKENEIPPFQKKILAIDPDAFIIFSESQQIVGNGFHVYR